MKKSKKLIALIAFLGIVISCGVNKEFTYTPEQMKATGLSTDGWNIMYGDDAIARVESIEWEFYEHQFYREISLTLLDANWSHYDSTKKIIKYVHTRYPDSKIEVNKDIFFQKQLENE